MNNDNSVVQGLWVGGRLSALERLCIRSFCAHGHEFHLYHYDELQNLPRVDELRLMNAADILPRTAIFRYHRHGSLAGFADHFRWELMRQKGGWYADMDMVCLRPLDFAADVVIGWECGGKYANSAMMKFPRGHFMAAAMADACANVNKFVPWDDFRRIRRKIKRIVLFRNSPKYIKWGEAGGPVGTTLAIKHFGMEQYVRPVNVFYYTDEWDFLDHFISLPHDVDDILSSTPELRCIHFGQSDSRRRNIDKDGKYPADSLYEMLKRRYGESEQ